MNFGRRWRAGLEAAVLVVDRDHPAGGRSPSWKRASRSRRCGARARRSWDSGAARAGARGRCRGPRGHGRDLERRLGHGRRTGRGWYEGVERRDVLVVPIDTDGGRRSGRSRPRRTRGAARASAPRPPEPPVSKPAVPEAPVSKPRVSKPPVSKPRGAGRRHPAGRSAAVFRAWHNHQRRQGGQHPRRGLLLRVVRRPSGPSSSTGRARVDRL